MNIKKALDLLQKEIKEAYSYKNTLFSAFRLISRVIHKPIAWILANPDVFLSKKEVTALEAIMKRIKNKEPIQYILGYAEFYNHRFKVTPDVLIPRPETEALVDAAIDWIKTNCSKHKVKFRPLKVLDVGTGSGCIIISIAKELSPTLVDCYATDISEKALKVARENAKTLLGDNYKIDFIKADLFPKAPKKFHLICANLPYISEADYKKLPPHIKEFEPKVALIGGHYGNEITKSFLKGAKKHLINGGMVLAELAGGNIHTTQSPQSTWCRTH